MTQHPAPSLLFPPRMPASIDYEALYRQSLRRSVQDRARADAIEAVMLAMSGRLLGVVQEITRELTAIQRERRGHQVGYEIESITQTNGTRPV